MKFTTIEDWLNYQENTHDKAIDLGLDRIAEVLKKLPSIKGVQQVFFGGEQFEDAPLPKIVTVAGTNGKGSTCIFLQNLLLSNKNRVGVYTSPHIKNYTERFLINGEQVSEAMLLEAFDEIENYRESITLTYFEWATLAAFVIFAKSKLDFWILEVGLGGRLDAVNLANADIAIITSIGKDHQEYLGSSLNAIGSEKAGILRKDKTAIFSSRLMPFSILTKAEELNVRLLRSGEHFSFSEDVYQYNWQGLDKNGIATKISLPKLSISNANAAGALQAFMLIADNYDIADMRQVARDTCVQGRMQKIGKFILDVAHNPPAMVHLVNSLNCTNKKMVAIVGMLSDKDIANSLKILAEVIDNFYLISLPGKRGTSKEAMFAYGVKAGIEKSQMQLFDSMELAIEMAKNNLDSNKIDQVLIVGSFVTINLATDILN